MTKEERENEILSNVSLAYMVAHRYRHKYIEFEDRVSVCIIGLVCGVDTFNPSKGYKKSTYYVKCIINQLLMEFRKYRHENKTVSMEQPFMVNRTQDLLKLADVIADTKIDLDNRVEYADTMKLIENMLSKLNAREFKVITSLYGLGVSRKKQTLLANELGISQAQISRIHRRSLKKMRNSIKEVDKP